jgi:stage II sporulation protein D
MKEYVQTVAVFVIFLALIPCIAFISVKQRTAQAVQNEDLSLSEVKIYFTEEDTVTSYSVEDYVVGAVLSQMPADFESEALKAQAVLARTYITRRHIAEAQSPTAELKGADISDDGELYQSFFTETQAEEYYGDDYEAALDKVTEAVQAVEGEILTYNGNPIIAAFHAVSSGSTASALTAWGQDIPYLQSVDCSTDTDFDWNNVTAEISLSQFEKTFTKEYGTDFSELSQGENPIALTADSRGYVTEISVCGETVSTEDFISVFDIPSPCFTAELSEDSVIFSSVGYGHLVGMSQYGANTMAENGSDYAEILTYFFGEDVELSH